MRLTVRPCPATCVENELVRLNRGWTDHPVSWRTHDSTTRFDESTQGDSYVLTMSRVFLAADTKHYVWTQMALVMRSAISVPVASC
jgi:hypothetical protein